MATLVELAAEIVSSHASTSSMTTDELLQEIQKVYASLKSLEGGSVATVTTEEAKPAMTVKEAFKKNEVICMVCGKGKMKSLARHLKNAHDMKPGDYRKQFGIKSTQSLTAKAFSESRRQSALERGLATNLEKARQVRASNIATKKAAANPKNFKPAKVVKAKATTKPKK